ncbi:hypothetical protein POTOM_019942 [Populus tomentosa]|uniref:Isopenicillin N synthase-like Fe(2+) 2OG dioxygenase domain-containing protein n=1 Tax=Populus tomentosa TaxID=118781 RepID=A0A8X7ZVF5_POPTO|nr:hypothetical protein POTOM_019942 [Populus tomentosa]
MGDLQVVADQNEWIDVPLIVLNTHLFTKIISNDKFKSVEQRVQVGGVGARASLPGFLYPSRTAKYKPEKAIKGLLADKLTKYREIQFAEFMDDYKSKGSDGKPALPHFKA